MSPSKDSTAAAPPPLYLCRPCLDHCSAGNEEAVYYFMFRIRHGESHDIMSLPFCTITASIALRQRGRQNSNAIIWHSFHGVDITDKLQLKMCKTVAGEDGQAVMAKRSAVLNFKDYQLRMTQFFQKSKDSSDGK